MNNNLRLRRGPTFLLILGFAVNTLLFQNCSGGFTPAKGAAGDSSLASSIPSLNGPGQSPIRRLSNVEFENSMADAITMQFSRQKSTLAPALISSPAMRDLLSLLPKDTTALRLGTDQLNSTLSSARFSAYVEIGYGVAGLLTKDLTTLKAFAGACVTDLADLSNAACVNNFISNFGLIVFRSPVSPAEISELKLKISTWRDLIGRMLIHPRFITHIEREGELIGGNGVYRLSSYELAAKLASVFWKSLPDLEGLAAAESGKLNTPEGLRAEVKRLLASPKARETLWLFYQQWLAADRVPTNFGGSGSVYLAFSEGLNTTNFRTNLFKDGKDFLNGITWVTKGKLEDLFRSPAIYATDPVIASIYGVAPVTDLNQPRMDNSGNYRGILTRLIVTTQKPSVYNETNHILRGVFIVSNMLGQQLGDPADFSEQNEVKPLAEGASTRAEVAHKTSPGACIGCHSLINPAGFALAHFDTFGRYKTTEKRYKTVGEAAVEIASNPIDARTEIVIKGRQYQIDGAQGLVNALTGSGVLFEAFAKNYFRFTMGRMEDYTNDAPLLNAFVTNLKSQPLVLSLEELALHPDFSRAKATK